MPNLDVMVARFPGGGSEHPATTDYLIRLADMAARRKVAGCKVSLTHWRIDDTPITMGRNRAIQEAIKQDVHYLLMIDSDMAPDMYVGIDKNAKPFLETTLEFMLKHKGPCVVGAPYCGPPPHENVYVFNWQTYASNKAEIAGKIDQYSREHAAIMSGIQECAALPTGLIMFDMRCLKHHPFPHTYYEWDHDGEPCETCQRRKPGPRQSKASTEDVTLTRDLSLTGTPVYCNWDAWAGHFKRMCVGKPILITAEDVGSVYKEAILKNRRRDESMIYVGDPSDGPTAAEMQEARERSEARLKVLDAKLDATEKMAPIQVVNQGAELSMPDMDRHDYYGGD